MPKKNMKPKNITRKPSGKTAKPAISWLKIPIIPVNYARILLFSLLFAIVGVSSLIASEAAVPYTVKYIYFCSSANNCTSNSTANVDSKGNAIRTYYINQLGKKFDKTSTIGVVGQRSASYYGAGSYSTANTYYNVLNELNARGIIPDKSPSSHVKYAVVMGFHSMSHCGVGSGPIAFVDPYRCSSWWPTGLAHEMGHTWLTSSNSDHRSDGTLMNAPAACNTKALTSCSIYSGQKTKMRGQPWFHY